MNIRFITLKNSFHGSHNDNTVESSLRLLVLCFKSFKSVAEAKYPRLASNSTSPVLRWWSWAPGWASSLSFSVHFNSSLGMLLQVNPENLSSCKGKSSEMCPAGPAHSSLLAPSPLLSVFLMLTAGTLQLASCVFSWLASLSQLPPGSSAFLCEAGHRPFHLPFLCLFYL